MSLFYSDKPVITKVHGFCVAGGTDMALCSDMVVIEDTARIGYPPGRGAAGGFAESTRAARRPSPTEADEAASAARFCALRCPVAPPPLASRRLVWGTPTTALWMERIGVQRAKRMLLTGDLISGKQAVEWSVARTNSLKPQHAPAGAGHRLTRASAVDLARMHCVAQGPVCGERARASAGRDV